MLELLSDSELEKCDLQLDNFMKDHVEFVEKPLVTGEMLRELDVSRTERNKFINAIRFDKNDD